MTPIQSVNSSFAPVTFLPAAAPRGEEVQGGSASSSADDVLDLSDAAQAGMTDASDDDSGGDITISTDRPAFMVVV